ncbi:MAG: hypothetical protein LBH58_08340 [Tannerellaceae bacterium]|jgi:hypothetical protein|nr:hypothetical protein [Tannerellaceae bacterium]
MKKVYLMFAVFVLSLSFVACGGKGSDKPASEDASAVEAEAVVPEAEVAVPAEDNEVLARYEAIVNRVVEMYEEGKLTGESTEAMEEYAKLAQEITEISGQLQKEMQDLTPAQAERFAALGERLANAATKALGN